MKIIAIVIWEIYLWFVIWALLYPATLIRQIIAHLKGAKKRVDSSYLEEVRYGGPLFTLFNRRYHSPDAASAAAFLMPFRRISRYTGRSCMAPNRPPFKATPNEAAAIVVGQITDNLRSTKLTAEGMDAEYIFALQPTLMDTGPVTNDDELFLKKRREGLVWGFPYINFYSVYYKKLRDALLKDSLIKDNFYDTSGIFAEGKKQFFVDTCHLGDMGQELLSERVAEYILKKESE